MKNIFLFFTLSLITLVNNAIAQKTEGKTFESYRELGSHAFSNTNLNTVTNGYLFDFAFGFYDDKTLAVTLPKTNKTNADLMLSYLDLIEKTDVNGKFKTDTLLFPFMYGFYAANGYTPLTLPLVITDMDISVLKTEPRRQLNEWKSDNPFPKYNDYDFKLENVFNASVFCDTLVYSNIELYWTDETYVSNTNREVENVFIIANNQTIEIPKSTPTKIDHLFDVNRPLKKITIKIEFSDGTIKTTNQKIYLKKNENYNEFSETRTGNNPDDGGFIYGDVLTEYDNFTVTHSLEWKTYYGCTTSQTVVDSTYTVMPVYELVNNNNQFSHYDTIWEYSNEGGEQVLDKPYFFIMGWGPFTDNGFINSGQSWPTPMDQYYATVDYEG